MYKGSLSCVATPWSSKQPQPQKVESLAPTHAHRERVSDADLCLGYTNVGGRFI